MPTKKTTTAKQDVLADLTDIASGKSAAPTRTATKKAVAKGKAAATGHEPATKKKAPKKATPTATEPAPAAKPAKAKAAKKAKVAPAGPVLRDGFTNPNGTGRKVGSNAHAINRALTTKPQTVDAIKAAAGVDYAGAGSHLNSLRKEGWVEHVAGAGFKLTAAGVKAQKVDPA